MFDLSKCKLDKDGNYLAQTREGRPVTFAKINGRLVGCIRGHANVFGWTCEGKREVPYWTESSLDLINIPEPKRSGEVWVNIYGSYEVRVHNTRQEADESADGKSQFEGKTRIACVRVPWTEGEGLEGK